MSGSLGEREIEVGTSRASQFSRHFEFSQTSTSVSITMQNNLQKAKTCSLLKRKFSILFMMAFNGVMFPCFPYSYRNTAFSQSKFAFSKCYFIKRVNNSLSDRGLRSKHSTSNSVLPAALHAQPSSISIRISTLQTTFIAINKQYVSRLYDKLQNTTAVCQQKPNYIYFLYVNFHKSLVKS